jgi:Spy/CpxP family protein refolding chaperone
MGGDQGLIGMQDQLGLSDAQIAKIKAVHQAHRGTLRGLMQKARADIKNLAGLVDSQGSDADLTAAVNALKADRSAIQKERELVMDETGEILTPMQEAKAALALARAMMDMGRGARNRVHADAASGN